MADPLSVAGLAAGLVSLGLQVCGGIITYVDALDCREQEIASVRQQHHSLQITLRVVETSLSQLPRDHQEAAAAARDCLDVCQAKLKELESLVAELASSNSPSTSRRDKIRHQSKKLLYPFSRVKLEQLETRLQSANATLQLALQALGLSASHLDSEKLARLESGLLVVQSHVSAIQGINTGVDDLKHLITQLLVSRQASTLEAVAPRVKKSRALNNASSTLKAQTTTTSSQLVSSTAHRGNQFQDLVPSFLGGASACVCRRVFKRSDFVWGPVGFSHEITAHQHLPGCPVARVVGTDGSRRISLKYTGFRRLLNSAVQLSFAMNWGMGGWSISPNVTYYPTVDETTAPAFRTLELLLDSLTYCNWTPPQWEKFVALALTKISRLFQSHKASPLAVDSANRSLAHMMAYCIGFAIDRPGRRYNLSQPLLELFRYLVMYKVPTNQYDLYGRSPLTGMMLGNYNFTSQHVAASEFILRSSPETFPACLSRAPRPFFIKPVREPKFARGPILSTLRFVGCSSLVSEAYGCGPLSLAILANDSAQVEFLLEHHLSVLGERNLFGHTPLHLAVENPEYLQLLVRAADSKLLNGIEHEGTSAIEIAVLVSGMICKQKTSNRRCRRCHCAKSTAILIGADCAVPVTKALQSMLKAASRRCKLKYVRAIRDRRQRLKQLALANLSTAEADRLGLLGDAVLDYSAVHVTQLLEQRGVQVPDALECASTEDDWPMQCVYHMLNRPEDADLFFRLGFSVADNFRWEDYVKTPGHKISPNYLRWLAEHGVDILHHWLKSFGAGRGIVTAHLTFGSIGLKICKQPSWPPTDVISWTQEICSAALSAGTLDLADNCRCDCCPRGCTPLAYAWKQIALWVDGRYRFTTGKTLEELASAWSRYLDICGRQLEPRHHRAALRSLTFEALKMRHQCCPPFLHTQFSEDWLSGDVEDENTPQEVALLEELTEEFEAAVASILDEADKDRRLERLVDFWKRTWVGRMVEIREQRKGNALSEDERRGAEEIGVVWDVPAPEVVNRNPYGKSTEGHWFYEMNQIEVE